MAIVRGGIPVKPHVQRFADDLERHLEQTLSFGTYPGHSPPEGPTQALDIFNPVSESGFRLQDRICDFARRNQRKYGVRYCIRRTQIWNVERDGEGWRNQRATGDPTVDHYDHVHITFYARAEVVVDDDQPPIIEGDVMSLSVRYIYTAPSGDGDVDWVFDGPSRIFAPVGEAGVLKAADKCKFPELGRVTTATHDWFVSAAAGWKEVKG